NSTLEKMSRPTWSVPNRCAADGGFGTSNACVAVPASPGCGASTGAKIAASTISRTSAPPAISSGLARRPRQSAPLRGPGTCCGVMMGDSIIAASPQPDPRVDAGLDHVHDKIRDHVGDRDEERHTENGRCVKGGDRRGGVAAEPRPVEDGL